MSSEADGEGSWEDGGLEGPPVEEMVVHVERRGEASRPMHPRWMRDTAARHLEAGELQAASALLRRALCLSPDDPQALYSFGQSLARQGRHADAAFCLRRALERDPGAALVRLELGRVLLELGEAAEAVEELRRLLTTMPAEPTVRRWLGRALWASGRVTEGMAVLRDSVKMDPRPGPTWSELTRVLLDRGEGSDAEYAIHQAEAGRPRSAPGLGLYGWTLMLQNRLEGAGAIFAAGHKIDPAEPLVAAGLTELYLARGDLHRAQRSLHSTSADHRQSGRLMAARAHFAVAEGRPAQGCRELERALAAPLPRPERQHMLRALGDCLDALEDPERAVVAWSEARSRQPAHQPGRLSNLVDRIIQAFPDWIYEEMPQVSIGEASPVFVVGVPGSGTGLVESLLAAQPLVFRGGRRLELQRIVTRLPTSAGTSFPECMEGFELLRPEKVLGPYKSVLSARGQGQRWVTDSHPLNFLYLGLAAILFPGARVVRVLRHPGDLALRCLRSPLLQTELGPASHPDGLAELIDCERRLFQHWGQSLPLQIHTLRYEDMVTQPEATAAALCRSLGLPAGDPGFSLSHPQLEETVGRWQQYVRWLGPAARMRPIEPPRPVERLAG